jgi:hypothetical protein
MVSLTSDQYQFIHSYYNLLNTIEEGFGYVIESFSDLELTEGERIFKDILAAFYHVDSSNKTLQTVLTDKVDLVSVLENFDQVILTLEGESSIFTTLEKHHKFVENQLAPTYRAWKESIQSQLQPYITQ